MRSNSIRFIQLAEKHGWKTFVEGTVDYVGRVQIMLLPRAEGPFEHHHKWIAIPLHVANWDVHPFTIESGEVKI